MEKNLPLHSNGNQSSSESSNVRNRFDYHLKFTHLCKFNNGYKNTDSCVCLPVASTDKHLAVFFLSVNLSYNDYFSHYSRELIPGFLLFCCDDDTYI